MTVKEAIIIEKNQSIKLPLRTEMTKTMPQWTKSGLRGQTRISKGSSGENGETGGRLLFNIGTFFSLYDPYRNDAKEQLY